MRRDFLCLITLAVIGFLLNPRVSAGTVPSIKLGADLVLGREPDGLIGVVTSVVQDSKGFIYVADVGFQYVHKFSSKGKSLDVFGSVGEGPGELMYPFIMTIDSEDKLYFAGPGGRITIWSTDGVFLREFKRIHPDGTAKSIRVDDDGNIYLAALSVLDQTTIDVYGSDGDYKASFGQSYAAGKDVDIRTESFVGGGSIALLQDGRIAYTQQVPYEISVYSLEGQREFVTTEGGSDFLSLPPDPDYTRKTFKMALTGASVEITALGSRLLNCAIRDVDDEKRETLFTLYDGKLHLEARSVVPGSKIVVGKDRENRVFVFSRDEDVPLVRRVVLRTK